MMIYHSELIWRGWMAEVETLQLGQSCAVLLLIIQPCSFLNPCRDWLVATSAVLVLFVNLAGRPFLFVCPHVQIDSCCLFCYVGKSVK